MVEITHGTINKKVSLLNYIVLQIRLLLINLIKAANGVCVCVCTRACVCVVPSRWVNTAVISKDRALFRNGQLKTIDALY